MSTSRNFLQRAVEAIVESRTRQAERYVARYASDDDGAAGKVKSR